MLKNIESDTPRLVQCNLRLPKTDHKKLKHLAIERGCSLTALILEAIHKHLLKEK